MKTKRRLQGRIARERMNQIKLEIVKARRAGNDQLAAELSGEKAELKKRLKGNCIDCGVAIIPTATRCGMHAAIHRRFGKRLTIGSMARGDARPTELAA